MADTGAPWNIPFAEPADLVRDWPALSEDVADAVAAGLTAAGNAGIGSNVVQTVKTDTFTTTSASFVDVTGLTATITPSSGTSKVLVSWSVSVGQGSDLQPIHLLITDGSNNALIRGDANGDRGRVTAGVHQFPNIRNQHVISGSYLWSPETTSPVTAKVRVTRTNTGTVTVNRTGANDDNLNGFTATSTVTLIEVSP